MKLVFLYISSIILCFLIGLYVHKINWEMILPSISAIGTLLGAYFMLLSVNEMKRQHSQNQIDKEHSMLLQHIDNVMIPLATKLRQDHDLLQTDPNFISSVVVEWDQLHQKSIGTSYSDNINQIYTEIDELWKGYNYRTHYEDSTHDLNAFEIVWAIFQLYGVLNNKKKCDELKEFLAGLNENFNIMKRHHIDKEEQETRERITIKKEQTLLKFDTMIDHVVNTIKTTEKN